MQAIPIRMTYHSRCPFGWGFCISSTASAAAAISPAASAPPSGFFRTESITSRLRIPPERLYRIAVSDPNRNPDRITFVSIRNTALCQSIRYTAYSRTVLASPSLMPGAAPPSSAVSGIARSSRPNTSARAVSSPKRATLCVAVCTGAPSFLLYHTTSFPF